MSADDYDEVHLPVEITVETNDTLLLLMASNEPNVLMPTISALREQIKDESFVNTIIDRIVEIARTFTNDQVLIVVSWYLAALADSAVTEKWAFDVISKSGAIPYIVSFAKHLDNASLSERCFNALVALSDDTVTSREIISNGALGVFKEALKNEDPQIQSQVALALFRMSTDFENRKSILKEGLLDSMIDFLANEDTDEEVLTNTLQALGNILTDNDCVTHFEERQGWNSVMPFIDDADKNIQVHAYSIISQVSNVDGFKFHFDDDLLQRFITALTESEEFDPILEYLLTILMNTTSIKIVILALAQNVPFLLDRMYSEHTEMKNKEIIAKILSNLSKDGNTHSAILEPEQLQRICGLLKSDSLDVRRSALQVISEVCENKSIRQRLHDYGAIECMLGMLSGSVDDYWTTEFHMIVLPILYKMIGDSKLKESIIQKSIGDLETLIGSEFPDILNTSLLILATLATEESCRDNLAERPSFLQKLIDLIGNKKVAIRRNTLHTINSLSVHPKITTQFCNFGLIEKLRKFAASPSMINLNLSIFATTALETICTSNVIAKFWVKNVLDFDDIIEDGFYSLDPRADCYKSIDDLLNDVIHLRIETLLLDKNKDEGLQKLIQELADSFTVVVEQPEVEKNKKSKRKNEAKEEPQTTVVIPEWPHIATSVGQFVINKMGGKFEGGRIPYEAEVSRCKYKTHSDVVMLGQLQVGTIRHRGLMFKYLAQLYGMEVSIKRNKEDLSCDILVKKGTEIYKVCLNGCEDVITPA